MQSENDKRSEMIKINIKDIQNEIKSLNKQKSSLHDLLEKGVYDIPTFLERSKVLAEKLNGAEKALAEKQEQLKDIETAPPIKEAVPILKHLLYEYDNLSVPEKNALYKQLIKRMTYTRTKDQSNNDFTLQIEWRYVL